MSRILKDPVGEIPGWYYLDATDLPCGPFDTEADAEQALEDYEMHRDMMDYGWSENVAFAERRKSGT